MGFGMRCPNCEVEMEDFGQTKECMRCNFIMYFGVEASKIEKDVGF